MRVRLQADLLSDLEDQLAWIPEQRDATWAVRLREDLDEALDVLAQFPLLGMVTPGGGELVIPGGDELRWLPLRRTPYVLWYALDHKRDEVWVLRLFQSRQSQSRRRRPKR